MALPLNMPRPGCAQTFPLPPRPISVVLTTFLRGLLSIILLTLGTAVYETYCMSLFKLPAGGLIPKYCPLLLSGFLGVFCLTPVGGAFQESEARDLLHPFLSAWSFVPPQTRKSQGLPLLPQFSKCPRCFFVGPVNSHFYSSFRSKSISTPNTPCSPFAFVP